MKIIIPDDNGLIFGEKDESSPRSDNDQKEEPSPKSGDDEKLKELLQQNPNDYNKYKETKKKLKSNIIEQFKIYGIELTEKEELKKTLKNECKKNIKKRM